MSKSTATRRPFGPRSPSPHVDLMAAEIPYHSAQPAFVDWTAELLRHRSWLRAVIYARLGQQDGVDDVFQEVSVAVVEKPPQTPDASRTGAWLYQVAVNQALQYLRTQGREQRKRKQLPVHRNPSDAAEPLDWLLADERRSRIRAALGQLTADDRELIVLKYTQECSYRELSEYLGISVSALESRLHRARSRLRKLLTLDDVFEDES